MDKDAIMAADHLIQRVAEMTDSSAFTHAQIITLAAIFHAMTDDIKVEQKKLSQMIEGSTNLLLIRLGQTQRRNNWLEWLVLLLAIGNVACWYWLSSH